MQRVCVRMCVKTRLQDMSRRPVQLIGRAGGCPSLSFFISYTLLSMKLQCSRCPEICDAKASSRRPMAIHMVSPGAPPNREALYRLPAEPLGDSHDATMDASKYLCM